MIVCYNKGTYEGSKLGCQVVNDAKFYLNLTNGIEFLENCNENINFKFVRIQSTMCEQHLWDRILNDLDYNFLLDLALGYEVIVFDTTAKKKVSRALYQGLKFVEYALNRIWFDKKIDAYVKNVKCNSYFDTEFNKISDNTIKKIKYLKKFLNTKEIYLKSVCINTIHDGDYEYYKNILIKNY